MIGIYFSGTGNTKHCVEKFLECYGNDSKAYSIEDKEAINAIEIHRDIVFAYPVYYSTLPKIVHEFLVHYGAAFRNKNVYILATMGLFSGDGAGCAARMLKENGAHIRGGFHVLMPNNIGDHKVLHKTDEKNKAMILRSDEKIEKAVRILKHGKPYHNGLHAYEQVAGLLTQRLWFSSKTRNYFKDAHVDNEKCSGCGTCIQECPMKNIKLVDGKACFDQQCTLCYRCLSLCPNKAITLLGKEVYTQYYLGNMEEKANEL